MRIVLDVETLQLHKLSIFHRQLMTHIRINNMEELSETGTL